MSSGRDMSSGDLRGQFLYDLPSPVLWDFCRLMDGLSDRDWTRFASEVLGDQTAVRLAERRERRTDCVMDQWGNRKGRVGELIDLLERLQLLRPRDVILGWASRLKPPSPPPAAPPAPTPSASPAPFDPPPKQSGAPPTLRTCRLCTTVDEGGGGALPRPAPPPLNMQSGLQRPPQVTDAPVGPQRPLVVASGSSGGVMCWSYEEVHAGTAGFSPSLQVGEGGFGVVYRATLRNTDCAVKRLKQDCLLDWTLLRESFQTEVDKLTKFRHPNIVELLGISEGPGSVCLIYSYMELRSLEDQLHNGCASLSWSQRLGVVKGASAALQFLHSPPDGHSVLIHGDVKSSNILLDCHLVAKLADFGLARFACRAPSGRSAAQTVSVGKTATVRGTLAYLPDEYVRNGELGTAVDVFSFGVVLLEVLTGRRALEKDRKSGDRYLKDLVEEVEDGPGGSCAAVWRKHVDQRLISGGAVEPAGCLEAVALACRCLDRKRKKRPSMTEVFDKLQDIHIIVRRTSSSSSPLHHLQPPSLSLLRPPRPLDSTVGALSDQLSKLGPLEDTYQPSPSSQLSSLCSFTPPHPLHSCASLPSSSSSSLAGPCETDESRGFSQYDLRSQCRFNGTSSRCLSPSSRDHSAAVPPECQLSQPSVPTEDQYSFSLQPSTPSELTGGPSPGGSLQAASPGPSVHMNPSKLRFLQKKRLYEDGQIQTPELLSSDDLYGGRSSVRGPEESDELDYLHHY